MRKSDEYIMTVTEMNTDMNESGSQYITGR